MSKNETFAFFSTDELIASNPSPNHTISLSFQFPKPPQEDVSLMIRCPFWEIWEKVGWERFFWSEKHVLAEKWH